MSDGADVGGADGGGAEGAGAGGGGRADGGGTPGDRDGGGRWLLYGAYGFTGRLVAREAVARGRRPVLAGRDPARVRALAGELGLEGRAFALDAPSDVAAGVEGVHAVLNCAGPFADTWRPLAEACLSAGVTYLDVTGEIAVLEAMQGLDGRAREAGLVMVPAVGFDVVPTDCAAVLAAGAVDEPVRLDLAFRSSGGPSRGTARTALRRLGGPGAVRRGGEIVEVPHGSVVRQIPFSDGAARGVAIPWGDVSTAWRSTGVPDIRVFTPLPRAVVGAVRWLGGLLGLAPVRWVLDRLVAGLVDGPDDAELESGRSRVWAEAVNARGEAATVELVTPNGYTLTARSAVEAVARVLAGDLETGPGVVTPARAFGAGFALSLEGVERVV